MHYKVHLALNSSNKTNFKLFPSPESCILNWNKEMAERILPVAEFDLSKTDNDSPLKAFFIYYDDYATSFLSWTQLDNGMIQLDDAWKDIAPFEDPPSIQSIEQKLGAYLDYEGYDIDIDLPSNFDYENRWDRCFEQKLEQAGAKDALRRIRLGGGFPCYVQGIVGEDDPGFVAEFPTLAYDLSPIYLYLFYDGKGDFWQEMQMT